MDWIDVANTKKRANLSSTLLKNLMVHGSISSMIKSWIHFHCLNGFAIKLIQASVIKKIRRYFGSSVYNVYRIIPTIRFISSIEYFY